MSISREWYQRYTIYYHLFTEWYRLRLEWKRAQNMADKIQVRLIVQLRAAGMSQTAIARERNMSKSSVSDAFQIAEERNISYADIECKTPDEVYRMFYLEKHL